MVNMLRHMRTTVRLDDALMKRAKHEAAKRGETFTSLIEKGLRLVLAQPTMRTKRPAAKLPVCKKGGGTLPGVDIGNSASLLDQMEGIQ
jgi:hypothetical protein